MKANPGGNLNPEGVYGRDQLIAMLWERLEAQSVVITAERRIGKTQVLLKMRAEPKPGWKPIYRNVEKIHTALEFAELVYDDVQEFLGTLDRAKGFVRRFFEENETDHVNIKTRTWKKLLTSAVEDLMATSRDHRLVFFWDEFPWMVESIRRNEGSRQAVEILDTIRSLRSEQNEFRVIFTGSIGLHHVLEKLSADGYPTPGKNDMYHVTVPPLHLPDAERLALDLLAGENIACSNPTAAARRIAVEVDSFPFYIHHIVAGLKEEQLVASDDTIKDFVSRQLVKEADPWQLAHYRTRLSSYYPENDDAKSVALVLDVLALTNGPAASLSVDEILEQVPNRGSTIPERDELLRLLRLMVADHYLTRDSNGGFRFRFPLIRRWWKKDRGL
jgi:hypothetical protein